MNYRKRFKEQTSTILDNKTPNLNFDGKIMFNEAASQPSKPKLGWTIYVPVFSGVAALGIVLSIALWPKAFDAINPPDYYVNVPALRSGDASFRSSESLDIYNDFVATFSPLVFASEDEFDARSFSPVDAFVNVAILGYVSTGSSQSEILDALGVETIEELNSVTKDVIDVLGSGAGYALNSFWFDDDVYDIKSGSDNLLEALSNYYYTNIIARRPTSELVNEWLDIYVPKDRFPIVPEVELQDGGSDAAIASSYFAKSTWNQDGLGDLYESEFERDNHKMTFKGRDEDKQIDYIDHGAIRLLADDYAGASLALEDMEINFFLPDLDSSVSSIFSDVLNDSYTTDDYIRLNAPYFKIDNRLDLIPSYRDFGLNDVFDVGAAQGLLNSDSLVVTGIQQFSTMSFDFGGLYSASVTVTELNETAGYDYSGYDLMVIDRPFVFTASYHGATILVGQVFNPIYE